MIKLSSDEIKQTELSILKEFDSFCKNNNLTYYLCGGTLLGAIRHKGFIPWDDDIDVFMPRPDYERFRELTSFNPIKNNIYTCSAFPCKKQIDYPFVKLLDMTTKVIEEGRPKQFMAIWIDIFPVDGFPENIKERKKYINKMAKLRRWFCACSQDFIAAKNFLNLLKRLIPTILLRLYGTKGLCKHIDSLAKKYPYNDSSTIGCTIWGYGIKECIDKSNFSSIVKVDFENQQFNAMNGWDNYLKSLYGNYMQLPPEEKRVCHNLIAYKLNKNELTYEV